MITQSYDPVVTAKINPENTCRSLDISLPIGIATFSKPVIDYVLSHMDARQITGIATANGIVPVYAVHDEQAGDIAVYMTGIGAPLSGAFLEELRVKLGIRHFICFGSAGVLDRNIAGGHLLVPTAAYRDEGLSYHYAPASDYIETPGGDALASFMMQQQIPFLRGRTWTTDAFYRETPGHWAARKAEGCLCVEMECAGLQAVCDFRGISFYPFFIGGDNLDSEIWESRILGDEGEHNAQVLAFDIALQFARTLKDQS